MNWQNGLQNHKLIKCWRLPTIHKIIIYIKMSAPYVKCRCHVQNVGALCKMSAPYVKCRRLKCWRPMQNVGALKCQRLLKDVGAHEIF